MRSGRRGSNPRPQAWEGCQGAVRHGTRRHENPAPWGGSRSRRCRPVPPRADGDVRRTFAELVAPYLGRWTTRSGGRPRKPPAADGRGSVAGGSRLRRAGKHGTVSDPIFYARKRGLPRCSWVSHTSNDEWPPLLVVGNRLLARIPSQTHLGLVGKGRTGPVGRETAGAYRRTVRELQ